jgi:hypothetical protein
VPLRGKFSYDTSDLVVRQINNGEYMRVCGVEIKGSDAIVVVIDGTKDDFEIIDTGVQKIKLGDSNESEDVKIFNEKFHLFVRNNNINKIGIKKRNTKGRFAGGAASFKIEGIIQLSKDSIVELIAPVSISSTIKKLPPPSANQLFEYQKGSYETAYVFLAAL